MCYSFLYNHMHVLLFTIQTHILFYTLYLTTTYICYSLSYNQKHVLHFNIHLHSTYLCYCLLYNQIPGVPKKSIPKTKFLSSANEVNTGPTCQFLSVRLCFRSFFQGVELDDILASDSGSGNLLIRLGV